MSDFRTWLDRIVLHGFEFIGLYYGEYEGEVVDVEDPKGLMRVRAKCHALWPDTEDAPDIWAWPGDGPAHANKKGGVWWPRQVGDPIIISCRNGNPSYPRYRAGWWGKDDIPDDARNTKRFFRAPFGFTVEFDDELERFIIYAPPQDGPPGRIIMEKDGRIDFFAGGSASWLTLLANGSLQHVTETGGIKNRLRINADGTVFIGPEDETLELIRLLVELVTSLTTMTTATAAGPQPPVNLAEFVDILGRLTPLIAPMPA